MREHATKYMRNLKFWPAVTKKITTHSLVFMFQRSGKADGNGSRFYQHVGTAYHHTKKRWHCLPLHYKTLVLLTNYNTKVTFYHYTIKRWCYLPTFSGVFLVPRANAELVPKFHVALHTSHAALSMQTLNISPGTNVTLTFYFGLDHPVHGGYGWGSPTPRRRSNCQTKKLKSPRRTGRQTVGRNVTSNCTCVITLQITDPSSRLRGRPKWKIKTCSKRGKTTRRTGRMTVGRNVTSSSLHYKTLLLLITTIQNVGTAYHNKTVIAPSSR
jgi:hypothetical protein